MKNTLKTTFAKTKAKKFSVFLLFIVVINHKNSIAQPPIDQKMPNLQEHSLKGKWNWVFLDTGASHKMYIDNVQHYQTHSDASGTIESLEEQCPIQLIVYNAAKTQLISNKGNVNINHDGHVIINATCKNASVLAMGYGLSSKIGSILGRSDTKIVGEDKLIKQPFVISRTE
ncbi:MAG: hypothetical protein RL344_1069 [Pseudomonadota bacterium]|jgi:hypothetical protein